jgi:hypothetical protein
MQVQTSGNIFKNTNRQILTARLVPEKSRCVITHLACESEK